MASGKAGHARQRHRVKFSGSSGITGLEDFASQRNGATLRAYCAKVEFGTGCRTPALSLQPPEATSSIVPRPAGPGTHPRRPLRRRRLCRRGRWVGVGRRARRGRRRIVSRLDRIVLNLLFHRAQLGDVLLVLVVGVAEGVAAGAVGDEEQIAGARRIGGGFQRGPPRIGDRPRRQAVNHIGVVGRRLLDFAALDRPAQRALAADQPVDDGRIRLQLYLLPQPIDEYRGDPAALVRPCRFPSRRSRPA